ncbi:MAG: WD40 repeat domain-containing protein, partial [Chloroflexota bacterium]
LSQERVYTNHSGWVLDAVFSPDSSLVASSGADETVQVWTVSIEDLIADVCNELARDLTPQERLRFSIMDDEATCQ